MMTQFHYLARGIVRVNARFLLAHQIGADNTFLPGGHIGSGERAEDALVREVAEELGLEARVKRFIGAVECAWPAPVADNHEINLLFELEIPGLDGVTPPDTLESHLEFIWGAAGDLERHNLQPAPLRQCLAHWDDIPDAFWGSAIPVIQKPGLSKKQAATGRP